jgi:hypothetical protein
VTLAIGAHYVSKESAGYDMHGFGYWIGGFFGAVCVVVWLLGRGLAVLARIRPRSAGPR